MQEFIRIKYCKPPKVNNTDKFISALTRCFENSMLIVGSSIWVDADVGFNVCFSMEQEISDSVEVLYFQDFVVCFEKRKLCECYDCFRKIGKS